jgi:hypothetical protein
MKTNNKEDLKKDSHPETNSRRRFLGTIAGAAAVAAAAPFLNGRAGSVEAAGNSDFPGRMNDCFNYRKNAAIDMRVNVGAQRDNGDAATFTDFSGNFSKALPHDSLGIPNAAAYLSLRNALNSGSFADFNSVQIGTPGGGGNSKLNGPQGALAFDLEGLDSHATIIPAAPSVASAQTGAELVEHYWGAILRDVPFTEYASNSLVAQACADMNNMSFVNGSANKEIPRPVTPQNLFRGQFVAGDGNVKGPYISQFMVQPTYYGAQSLDQRYRTFAPGQEFLTSVSDFQLVQNGGDTHQPINFDLTPRYIRCGRDLAAYTSVDVLYQAYFTAFMVLSGIGAEPNPGNPYIGSPTQKSFGTLGGPDAAGTLGEMATRALKASWFHKWVKDMRPRPEEVAGLVHARKTGASPMPRAAAALHADVLNSAGAALTQSTYGTYLLPQAFPEGSPTHPCYPTGHGTVGGACVTLLKFFFNGDQKIRPLLTAAGRDIYEPSSDGLSLNQYSGSDANSIDINGELSKLAWNVSVGHGIHSGIHFRSSTYWSILLGEQVALAILQDRARSYNEPFTISLKKFDGTTATIGNQ